MAKVAWQTMKYSALGILSWFSWTMGLNSTVTCKIVLLISRGIFNGFTWNQKGPIKYEQGNFQLTWNHGLQGMSRFVDIYIPWTVPLLPENQKTERSWQKIKVNLGTWGSMRGPAYWKPHHPAYRIFIFTWLTTWLLMNKFHITKTSV